MSLAYSRLPWDDSAAIGVDESPGHVSVLRITKPKDVTSPAAASRSATVAQSPVGTDAESPSNVTNRQLVRWMFQFLRPVALLAFHASLYLAMSILAEVLITWQSGAAVNQIQELHVLDSSEMPAFFGWALHGDTESRHLRNILIVLACLTVAGGVLRYLREVSSAKMSMEMVYHIREAVYDKLQRVGFGFHDAITSGQLINRALTDLQNVRAFVQTAVLTTLDIVLVVGGYIVLLVTRSPTLALLAMIPLPIWTIYILRFGRKVQPLTKAVMEAQDRNVSMITENIAGVHVVKAFATEQIEIRKYSEQCDSYIGRVLANIRLYANFTPVIRMIAFTSHLSLVFAASIFVLKGQLLIGDLLILGAAMAAILGRLQQVAVINEQYQNAIVSSRRLYEVLMAPPTVPEKSGAQPLPPGRGAVRFDRVSFGYNPDKPILHDITFEVPGDSVIAIVGPTGAGKSTLVNLLARFYDPQRGRIFVDGVDVRDVQLNSIRTQVAFVFQETYLFSDTVEANIAYSRPGVRGGEVEAAARLAQAHEFIEQLSHGYQTMLGERGSSLSGGQRQRLAIARAILQNPRILVLDDATAAVDPETEDLIRRGMNLVMQDRTTFVIAHRISTVKRADLVIVLENGRITQRGTHAQLMEQNGHYRDIAAVQLFGDVVTRDAEGDVPSHMDRMRDPRQLRSKPQAVTATGQSETPEAEG
jgi:ATP-binding cassette subfamily B protein